MPAGITIDSLCFAYKSPLVLDNISLTINQPGVYVLAGSNGSGKTTLLHILYGLLQPSSGAAQLRNTSGQPCNARDVCFIPDDDSLIHNLTGLEYLQFVSDCFGLDKHYSAQRITTLIQLFGLDDAARRLVRGYSHGMRKKLQLAAGLLPPTSIVLIDEPTNGLDPLATALATQIIAAAGKQQIIVVATHDMSLAEAVADRVIVLRQRILADGPPRQLMRQTKTTSLLNAYGQICDQRPADSLIDSLFSHV
jgi:ABC-2 type transport system ATP-binding protein